MDEKLEQAKPIAEKLRKALNFCAEGRRCYGCVYDDINGMLDCNKERANDMEALYNAIFGGGQQQDADVHQKEIELYGEEGIVKRANDATCGLLTILNNLNGRSKLFSHEKENIKEWISLVKIRCDALEMVVGDISEWDAIHLEDLKIELRMEQMRKGTEAES